ncbi:GNAT family N-acetyltransferase [Aeromicrobium duanguangcaii]|uniref:GNAT family N-acetyltransferase n=1 Tax=Aeromicrobium duanguangcaii TaxID=2968086 RepID=UPI0020178B2C|nr:GNAT family N-acetyltransferase [Aeromicrobium duanguangcaii]MCL3836967.1 GNAT family N-acetyltransferase [Aeromicrobium duanguangcaii]
MVLLTPVDADNWRDITRVRPAEGQREWVADTTYYLCLSAYGDLWRSYAVEADGATVGHVMWAVDPDDGSHWIGGLVIDSEHQRRGLGRATVQALLDLWEREEPSLSGTPYREAALSVSPDNQAAIGLYRWLGFVETGEMEDDEIVLRRPRA